MSGKLVHDNKPPPLELGLEDEIDEDEEEKYQTISTSQSRPFFLEDDFLTNSALSSHSGNVTIVNIVDNNNFLDAKLSKFSNSSCFGFESFLGPKKTEAKSHTEFNELLDLDSTLFQESSNFFDKGILTAGESSPTQQNSAVPKVSEATSKVALDPISVQPTSATKIIGPAKTEEDRKRRNRIYAKRSRDLKTIKFKQAIAHNKILEEQLRQLQEENNKLKFENQQLSFRIKEDQFQLRS